MADARGELMCGATAVLKGLQAQQYNGKVRLVMNINDPMIAPVTDAAPPY